ncbi:transcription termination factor, mitochondrial-like isoform X1 [Amphibalanus amphitrite]|uniref:transcription termination factor, mitochondrial-like isoform X1 n=1 Tax=Amphibalanus amphitrite TaxID=1232801 RepID=UPI001C91CF57|nr:transcription termination factor, mitochondrial-like isoform X1 [Amphibalanus amphitrite]
MAAVRTVGASGLLLARHIVSAIRWCSPPGALSKHPQQNHVALSKCLQQLTLTSSRHITCGCSQQQRSSVATVDGPTAGELRALLQFGTDRELRQFWRRTGARLDVARAANALHVLRALQAEGVAPPAIKRHPALLNIKKARLSEQLSSLRRLPAPVGEVFPLLLLRADQLRAAVRAAGRDGQLAFPGHRSRLHYLADQLQTGLETLCAAVRRNPSILTFPGSRITEITRLMIDGGIPRDAILDDPYIYNHNVSVMRERLEWVHRVQLRPLRPWMLRCAEHTLQEHVERFQLRLAILSEHGDEVTYLSERLGLGRARVSAFRQRHPPALRVSVIKMKEVLDVLLAYGISGEQVADQPRILCYSARRIRERCERLRAAGLRPASLLVLCKTPKDFDRYMAAATGAEGLVTVPDTASAAGERTAGDASPRTPA